MNSCTCTAMMCQSGTARIAGTTTVGPKMLRLAGCGPLLTNRVSTLMSYTSIEVRGQ